MPSQKGELTPTAIASIYGSADRFTKSGDITTAWFGSLPLEVDEVNARALQSKEIRLVEAAMIDGRWTITRVTILPSAASSFLPSRQQPEPGSTGPAVSAQPARSPSPSRTSPFPSRSSSGIGAAGRFGAAQPSQAARSARLSAVPPPASAAAGAAPRSSMISRASTNDSQPQPTASRPPFNPADDDEILDIPF